jgi:RNA polymerase sigma-70 factor (ECF subfamily)
VNEGVDRLRRLTRNEINRAYRMAGLILGNAADGEDATQDALLRAWRSVGSLRDPDRFEHWFDQILINACRDRLRRRRVVRFIELDPDRSTTAAVDPFRQVYERDRALRAMSVLDGELRMVVVLRFWADLSLEEVAVRLGWPLGTVKSRLHRALALMRERTLETPREEDRK